MSIRVKLAALLLTFTAIPTLFVAYTLSASGASALRTTRLEELEEIAKLKVAAIENHIRERRADISIAQNSAAVRQALRSAGAGPEQAADSELAAILDGELRRVLEAYGYISILLLDPSGGIVYAVGEPELTGRTREHLVDEWQLAVDAARDRVAFGPVYESHGTHEFPGVLLAAPCRTDGGELLGIVAYEVSMDGFYRLLQDRSGLGETGETVVARREDENILFVGPLRHQTGGALARTRPLQGKQAEPMRQALARRTGSGVSVDYRGERVLAAWHPVPALDWGLVAKIDEAEALAPVARLRHVGLLVQAVALTVALAAALAVARSITAPLRKLVRGARVVGEGDFTHRTGIDSADEVGKLSRAFDEMTEHLQETTARREELEREVAQRQEAEAALRRSEEMFRTYFELGLIGMAITSPEKGWVRVNRRLCEMLGYSANELRQMTWAELTYPEDLAADVEQFERLQAGEIEGYEMDKRFVRKDGTVIWAALSVAAVRGDDRSLDHVVAHLADITQRKEAQRELHLSEERFRATFEQAAVGIAHVSQGGRWLRVNDRLCKIVGYPREELLNLSFQDITHPDDLESDLDQVQRMLSGEIETYSMEKRYIRSDGSLVWVKLTVSLTHHPSGKPDYFISVVEDITERVAARERLQKAMAEMERSNEELEQFAYVASHDLQEPLRMVASFVQMLADRYGDKLDADAHEFIGYAVDGATRMKALINDLLAYSRVDRRGKEPEPTDANVALERALANLWKSIEESSGEVTSDDLPVVLADPTQLVQVFQNLIGNAVKFQTDEPPRVHLSAQGDGEMAHFTVCDNGIGVEPDQTERIFEIFERSHGQGQYAGTGIGLAITRKIVLRHGGRIWAEPNVEGGSTFHFTLPFARETQNA